MLNPHPAVHTAPPMRRLFRPYKHLGAGAALKSMPHTAHCPSSLCTPTTPRTRIGGPLPQRCSEYERYAQPAATLGSPVAASKPASPSPSPLPSPPRTICRGIIAPPRQTHARFTPGSPPRHTASPVVGHLPPQPPTTLPSPLASAPRFASTPASPSPSPRPPASASDSPGASLRHHAAPPRPVRRCAAPPVSPSPCHSPLRPPRSLLALMPPCSVPSHAAPSVSPSPSRSPLRPLRPCARCASAPAVLTPSHLSPPHPPRSAPRPPTCPRLALPIPPAPASLLTPASPFAYAPDFRLRARLILASLGPVQAWTRRLFLPSFILVTP